MKEKEIPVVDAFGKVLFKCIEVGDNLTVGGYLYLKGTQITSLPDNLTVGGSLDLEGTQITSLPDNLTVGGSLDLKGTQITSLPDNLTVGGRLYLEGTQITSLPDNLTVGGSLDLKGTQITSLPDNIHNIPSMLIWGGKYVLVDGIFAEVINHRGNVWETKRVGRKDIEYIVTDGNGKYAHGRTIREAKGDLIYKISNRDKSRYEGMKLTDTLTHEEAIEAYRVITGACSAGTRDFVENYLGDDKAESYTIEDIIRLTKGRFGSQIFADFFNS